VEIAARYKCRKALESAIIPAKFWSKASWSVVGLCSSNVDGDGEKIGT